MAKRMAHTIADYSTTISSIVQSKEVLDMGPIAADQLRKAGCLEVVEVDRPVHHVGGHLWISWASVHGSVRATITACPCTLCL